MWCMTPKRRSTCVEPHIAQHIWHPQIFFSALFIWQTAKKNVFNIVCIILCVCFIHMLLYSREQCCRQSFSINLFNSKSIIYVVLTNIECKIASKTAITHTKTEKNWNNNSVWHGSWKSEKKKKQTKVATTNQYVFQLWSWSEDVNEHKRDCVCVCGPFILLLQFCLLYSGVQIQLIRSRMNLSHKHLQQWNRE